MRVAFVGTEEIGELALRAVAGSRHEVVLVVTQPDRPKGRGRKIVPGAVRQAADELGIPLIQPESIRDEAAREPLKEASPDILAVVSYGEYIPESIYSVPVYGGVNVHPSLLPRWRGAAPVHYALLAGDTVTGVSVQRIHKKMDAGDILLQEEVAVEWEDNHATLCEKLYPLGAEMLVRVLDGLETGTIVPRPQDPGFVTEAPKIEKSDLLLDWSKPADEVRNRIRAFSPVPGARSAFRGSVCKVLSASIEPGATERGSEAGVIVGLAAQGPIVACSEGALLLTMLQPEGKKPIKGGDFINGYRPLMGERFEPTPQ